MGKPVDAALAFDLVDPKLWLAIASILLHATVSWYIVKWECTYRRLALVLGGSREHAGFVVSAAIFILGVIRHSCVFSAITSQPRWIAFHSNMVLVFGQITLFSGLALLGKSIQVKGAAQCLICIHYDVFGESFVGDVFPYSVLTEPVTIASLLIYTGLSLLGASLVGLLLSPLMLINHCNTPIFTPQFRARCLQR